MTALQRLLLSKSANWMRAGGSLGPRIRLLSSSEKSVNSIKSKYDGIVIGGGHNGLISATYLAKHGLKVAVFERRHVVGGAAVTEELFAGYKFSRASYVLSLLRPQIVKDLELQKHGLKVFVRTTGSFTPVLEEGPIGKPPRSLRLFPHEKKNAEEIGKFSSQDAKMYKLYEDTVQKYADAVRPLLDREPPSFSSGLWNTVKSSLPLYRTMKTLGKNSPGFYDFVTSPVSKTLDRWFETDVLKGTLATDGVIGSMVSPDTPGSSYVLLHHMIGEANGIFGAWGFVQGGMGMVSNTIAKAAKQHGVDIFLKQEVSSIDGNSEKITGVTLSNGRHIESDTVLSNATPKVTFMDLLDNKGALPDEYRRQISNINYSSPVTKINVAVDRIPNFLAIPNKSENEVGDHHKGTIHLNCENVRIVTDAYLAASQGSFSPRPMIEMCIPSTIDSTLAPQGHHVISLFTQYTPYYLNDSKEWSSGDRDAYRDAVFNSIESYAPGFKESVLFSEVLTPMDLEKIFGLTGGNIYHGAITLDQLFISRPTSYMASHKTPLQGLYLCGSGAHPGGGVMGASGRLAALSVLSDRKIKIKVSA